MRSGTKKSFTIILLGICGLAFWLFFSSNNGKKYFLLRKDLKSISMELEELKAQNKALEEEIHKLKTDKIFLEDVARHEYGFLKDNEVVFDFSKKKEK